MNTFTIDLSLQPTTLDLWHVSLAATVAVLLLILLIVLLSALFRKKPQPAVIVAPEPEIRIVEKIVEVEKRVQLPAPEPVILKEASSDAALQLLSLLQQEARFIDFIQENMNAYSDTDIGAAARIVHQGCAKAINEHFSLSPVSQELEGNRITLNPGFDANLFRLTGNISGVAPFNGVLVHKGWQVTEVRLPKLTENHNAHIIAAAEVEL
ncbi:DUF2760 domain-containing protein [Methylomonas paludis]|uniref:DUF2760 domain-containing protein n=1 Tax=Methylomonas paludis TaxID=1173101 RepID=A0A975RB04_9GAMM|nr:DUF2760 domain-containing protein [Methylomonas paludis]QWF71781.1 DUF2760 domain-containing protein [Methylomonas paludis]